ncbi:hypothetical protein CSOJ01_08911 [Colletotrichum sojae]|uniref:Uncharacterized protein n=1 Tax=Colletotrichum sojae TaxID=2175907 RepID=A0A8H6J4D1_9PEZI|nr:hypothetical protein CSOJ01_08911 [Colletotrichum sojae]
MSNFSAFRNLRRAFQKLRRSSRRNSDAPPAYTEIDCPPAYADIASSPARIVIVPPPAYDRNVVFAFGNHDGAKLRNVEEFQWKAWFIFKTSCLPKLMREGFRRSSENCYEHTRVCHLSELSDTSKWTASIEDMSLGWWPWPKAAPAEGEEAPNAAQEVEECRMV